MNLYHEIKASTLSNRTINTLRAAGITDWATLVDAATRTPNKIRAINGLGAHGVNEIIAALTAAKVTHTIPLRGKRGAVNPRS